MGFFVCFAFNNGFNIRSIQASRWVTSLTFCTEMKEWNQLEKPLPLYFKYIIAAVKKAVRVLLQEIWNWQIQNDSSVEIVRGKDSLALTEEEDSEFGPQDYLSAVYTVLEECIPRLFFSVLN